ncbi:uncharacterized protein LOC125369596 [Ricinus communis]|uniref:uncharacterized protein LOC125369596 n=1 Tax=Ricinus communis TaxID=3988 RepID=UPI00201A784D|nr:uncharacterized protein LOC125369596 [Ricinus communis]
MENVDFDQLPQEFVFPVCNCGQSVVLKASWTLSNPSRRFFGWRNFGRIGACGYFLWFDPPVYEHSKHVTNRLLKRVRRIEAENETEKRKAIVMVVLLSDVHNIFTFSLESWWLET